MSKHIEALKLALEALEAHADIGIKADKAITAIREALAEQPAPPPECQTEAEKTAFAFGWWKALEMHRKPAQQQEPDYCICPTCGGMASDSIVPPADRFSGKPWVGLTEVEIAASKPPLFNDAVVWELAVEWAQSQLKEKNK